MININLFYIKIAIAEFTPAVVIELHPDGINCIKPTFPVKGVLPFTFLSIRIGNERIIYIYVKMSAIFSTQFTKSVYFN